MSGAIEGDGGRAVQNCCTVAEKKASRPAIGGLTSTTNRYRTGRWQVATAR